MIIMINRINAINRPEPTGGEKLFTTIQLCETLNQDKAERLANKARKAGFPVECITDGWSLWHVKTRRLDYTTAFGIFLRMQKKGFTPVML